MRKTKQDNTKYAQTTHINAITLTLANPCALTTHDNINKLAHALNELAFFVDNDAQVCKKLYDSDNNLVATVTVY